MDEGKVPMSRIDDAVTRILRVKFAMGLMDPKRSQLADRSLQKSFGSPEHRAVARQAVRESLVLLKNDKQGAAALEEGGAHPRRRQERRRYRQSVRRLDHRLAGQERRRDHRRHDDSRRDQERRVRRTRKVTFSKDGKGAAGANVGVVVIGETPYAEDERRSRRPLAWPRKTSPP